MLNHKRSSQQKNVHDSGLTLCRIGRPVLSRPKLLENSFRSNRNLYCAYCVTLFSEYELSACTENL